MDTQTRKLSVTPRPAPALGADFSAAEPSHIHIPRPSRLRRERLANADAASELTEEDDAELPLATAA